METLESADWAPVAEVANELDSVILYGPDHRHAQRSGGVASHVRYLQATFESEGFPLRAVFPDWLAVDKPWMPRFAQQALGLVRASAQVLFHKHERGRTAVHINSSLYVKAFLRDLPIVLASRLRGFPVLLQVHGGRLSSMTASSFGRFLAKKVIGRSRFVGVHPGPQWDEFVEGGYANKMRRLLNLVPVTPDDLAVGPRGPAHFLYLGRVVREKGVYELLETFAQLVEAHGGIRLTIAGVGPALQDLSARSEELGILSSVSFPGFVRAEEKDQIMSECNVFVLPSRWQEGFPFSFLECAERGMSCLVTIESAIPEVFEDGKEFISLNMSDEGDLHRRMEEMASDVDKRTALGRAARKAVHDRCGPKSGFEQFRALYEEMIAPP